VLRRGGRLAFTTIELSPRLDPRSRRRARAAAPRRAGLRRSYGALLASAGFADVGERDGTSEYLDTTRAWLKFSEPHLDELAEIDGRAVIEERVQGWRDAIAALEAGWLRRTLYWGTRP
jgi:hypothetical protein